MLSRMLAGVLIIWLLREVIDIKPNKGSIILEAP